MHYDGLKPFLLDRLNLCKPEAPVWTNISLSYFTGSFNFMQIDLCGQILLLVSVKANEVEKASNDSCWCLQTEGFQKRWVVERLNV